MTANHPKSLSFRAFLEDTFVYQSEKKIKRLVSAPKNVTLTDSGKGDKISWYVSYSNEVFERSSKHYTEFFLLEYEDECQRVYVQDLKVDVFECHCENGGECFFGEYEGREIECQCPKGYGGENLDKK